MAKIKRVQFHMGNFTNPERMAYQKMFANELLYSLNLVGADGKLATANSVGGNMAIGFVRNDTQNLGMVEQGRPFAVVNHAVAYLDVEFAVGTILYLAEDGSITDVEPVTVGAIVQRIGVIIQDYDNPVDGVSDFALLDFSVLNSAIVV